MIKEAGRVSENRKAKIAKSYKGRDAPGSLAARAAAAKAEAQRQAAANAAVVKLKNNDGKEE